MLNKLQVLTNILTLLFTPSAANEQWIQRHLLRENELKRY
jgi:hypothetical protein